MADVEVGEHLLAKVARVDAVAAFTLKCLDRDVGVIESGFEPRQRLEAEDTPADRGAVEHLQRAVVDLQPQLEQALVNSPGDRVARGEVLLLGLELSSSPFGGSWGPPGVLKVDDGCVSMEYWVGHHSMLERPSSSAAAPKPPGTRSTSSSSASPP
ncbi:hypothetical protein [Sorangium sp. So ce1335]|uniref:hypothetical protein n=1 Tax=Sorangium sp. So ce1335 TaxID=3133335 RepID=UPI003F5FF931